MKDSKIKESIEKPKKIKSLEEDKNMTDSLILIGLTKISLKIF